MKRISDKVVASISTALVTVIYSVPAYAQEVAAMPWETPLRKLLASLQGTTAQIVIILAIILAGLAFAIGEAGSFFRRCSCAVFGGALAIGASTWAPTFFGW